MKIRFSHIVAISAFLVAGCAAYYSVFGLSQLFAGASLAVIIMASSLEFSKIIAVSLLQRFWSKISTGLRIYLSVGVIILVCITSAGIYGFLSNAYQKTANKYQISENEITVLNNKKILYDKNMSDNQVIINNKTKRVEQLGGLRTNQETRLDGATTNTNRNRVRSDIKAATLEIQILNKDIDTLNAKNTILLDSSNLYSNQAIIAQSKSTSTSEIGPLKYLSELTGQPMGKVVNWFVLLLIFVFDPLAVALVISYNKVQQLEIESDKIESEIPKLIIVPKEEEDYKTITDDVVSDVVSDEKIEELAPLEEVKIKEVPIVYEKIEDFIPMYEIPSNHIIEIPKEASQEIEELKVTEIPEEIQESEIIEEVKSAEIIEEPIAEEIQIEESIPEAPLEAFEDTNEVEIPEEVEDTPESIVIRQPIQNEPIIPNGKVELEDIKEVKETNRGFTMNIPHPQNNLIKRFK